MTKWMNLFKSILTGIPVGITFVNTVGYVARVDGTSMQPLFNPGNVSDYIYLNRWILRNFEINRGDVVSFISPKNPEHKIIKRVVGIQGDIIKTVRGKTEIVNVPKGYCWVEGDHIGHSMDSNYFGPVALGLITAKASAIVWPPKRWQLIKNEIRYERLPLNLLPLK